MPGLATSATSACDCCGSTRWEPLFVDHGHTLGRCLECGLHYIADMPTASQRMTEFEDGHSDAVKPPDISGDDWLDRERGRSDAFGRYLDIIGRYAPDGPWLDVGCGSGTLIALIQRRTGRTVDGLELADDRRRYAEQVADGAMYDRPLEDLALPAGQYAVISMVNVFSHLVAPSQTFDEVYRVLAPGGVLFVHTSEIDGRPERDHHRTWMLGDHLNFLGANTIDRYAQRAGFELAHRERTWQPELIWAKDQLRTPGPSRARNLAKTVLCAVPGLLPAARKVALGRARGNPMWEGDWVLRKP